MKTGRKTLKDDSTKNWVESLLDGIDPVLRAEYKRLADRNGVSEVELAYEGLVLFLEWRKEMIADGEGWKLG